MRRLQERIFKAYRNGNSKAGIRLQRLLLTNHAAHQQAVRKVTEVSKGRSTSGIDGVSRLSPRQKRELASNLSITIRPRSVRRTYIPKPGKAEKRPLGIPTIRDRAIQELVRMALEPQLEASMVTQAPDAYGFRPGRSRSDAAKALRNYLDKVEGKYVAICDIKQCFDRLDHNWVLQRIETWPAMQCYLRRILRAGYMEDNKWYLTEKGAPQGGPLSGLITNWALLGLEQYVSGHLRPDQRPGIIRLCRRHPHGPQGPSGPSGSPRARRGVPEPDRT
ncbi:reverse transcriptase N-terminal domain-containing protein [Ruficoccus amylovorans]|uniref:Reverse transcriptase N-terminal domain-containing protein n=1 Tax=Ruficoccus amylovorans TaxID=1804625 RepID=A0A842HFL2_9BACT|nr:reverse transcriptase N-terminal domain-containing protein [Ruficoccus amylovorans]